jgi:formylglycine-generating enzyme required for sulfatase activity
MKLVLIPAGEFMMGSPKEMIDEELQLHTGAAWYNDRLPGEGLQHRVRITRPYWLGATDVTQEEYQRVMGSNPSKFQGDPKRPVEQVSWDDAVEFCRRLSEFPAEDAAGRRYGLPTEAQWEYACRAGSTGRWCFSTQQNASPEEAEEKLLAEYAWFSANSDDQTHVVGQKRANAFGLHDLYGNVWQWCQDGFVGNYYAKSPLDDPQGPFGVSDRVARGAYWSSPARDCRSAIRGSAGAGMRGNFLGFRVCLVAADKPAEHAAVPAEPIVPAKPVRLDQNRDPKVDGGRQVTLRPAVFAKTYGWQNDPEKLRLSSAAASADKPRGGKAAEPK